MEILAHHMWTPDCTDVLDAWILNLITGKTEQFVKWTYSGDSLKKIHCKWTHMKVMHSTRRKFEIGAYSVMLCTFENRAILQVDFRISST